MRAGCVLSMITHPKVLFPAVSCVPQSKPIDKKPHLLSYKDLLSFFFHPSTRMKTPNRRTKIACIRISTYFIFSSVFIFNFVPFKKQSFIL